MKTANHQMGERIVTLMLVNLASVMERADEALLPAVYDEVGLAFGASPAALGMLTFIRALVQAMASPLAAYLALTLDRIHIISMGAVCWAVGTAGVGISTAYWQAAICKAVTGLGLAVVVPAIQSVVADLYTIDERGLGFGWLHAASQLGTVMGGIFATVMAGRIVLGMSGWRVAFLAVAALSLILSLALYVFAKDFRFLAKKSSESLEPFIESENPSSSGVKELLQETYNVLKIRTFMVIVAQGVVGQIPWNAMSFFTFWLLLLGFSHGEAALLVAFLSIGNMCGSIFGGWVGDLAAKLHPNAGRIACSQFSVGIAIPLSTLLLLGLPQDLRWGWTYGVTFFCMGFFMSWNSPATNWPIFAEIVPFRLHTTVYAIDLTIEKSLAAAGAPMVGFLAQNFFGYTTNQQSAALLPDLQNARALAHGLFVLIVLPFCLCMTIVNLLYFTYPEDRDKVKDNLHSLV